MCLDGLSLSVMVGLDPQEEAKWFRLSEGGIFLITQDMLVARAAKLVCQKLGRTFPAPPA
jgi:hypothetical protein